MRRTDMIETMVNASYAKHNGEAMDGRDFVFRLAETMLGACEDAGMEPPPIANPRFQGGWNIDVHPMYVSEWERE